MATARVTAAAVKEIISTSIANGVIDSNMIDTAHVIVDDVFGTASGLSEGLLKKIELYLAAHFVALTEEKGSLTRDKLGDADQSYANIFGPGFKSTRFGQTALSLDSTGLLAAASQTKLKAQFRIV